MKKEDLKIKFVELRATGYTYEKICSQLKITKPTAIKWGKLFEEEIKEQQKYLISRIFSERIIEEEQGILVSLEQIRRKRKMNLKSKLSEKIEKRLLKKLDKIFNKKIKAIHLRMNDDIVKSALFIFDEDIKVEEKGR
jgi:transcriptional regulator